MRSCVAKPPSLSKNASREQGTHTVEAISFSVRFCCRTIEHFQAFPPPFPCSYLLSGKLQQKGWQVWKRVFGAITEIEIEIRIDQVNTFAFWSNPTATLYLHQQFLSIFPLIFSFSFCILRLHFRHLTLFSVSVWCLEARRKILLHGYFEDLANICAFFWGFNEL